MSTLTLIISMSQRYYLRKKDAANWQNFCLEFTGDLLINLTIWLFSWKIFNVAIEVEERISRMSHAICLKIRKIIGLTMITVISTSLIISFSVIIAKNGDSDVNGISILWITITITIACNIVYGMALW